MTTRNTILIVEDNQIDRQALEELLGPEDYQLIIAENGAEALAKMEQHRIDLVLLDIIMPEMDGYEVCRHIRSTPSLANLPVIMLTALEGREDRLNGIEAGADDFISKPFDHDELRIRVHSILRLNRYRKILEQTERVAYLEAYDALTDLPNRKLLVEKMELLLDSRRHAQYCVAVMVVSLEGLAEINDTLGHDTGDQVIQNIAERLRKSVRHHDIVARLADDKFAIVATDSEVNYRLTIAALAQRIRHDISQPVFLDNREIYLNIRAGISLCRRERKDPETLITNATTAMKYAREYNEHVEIFYTDDMSDNAHRRVTMAGDLRRALKNNEICIFYQPRVDLNTGRITCIEAFIRWQHPEYGIIRPREFLGAAEESGLITSLGERALELVCVQAKQWQRRGLEPIKFAVKISSMHFRSANFVEDICDILNKYELPSSYLELEFTEDLLMPKYMEDEHSIMNKLIALKEMGIYMSIDNFGSGYSSLNHIARLPIDALKINRSFIINMFRSINDSTVTKSIIDLAHNLKLKAVAMGVETAEHRDFLRGWSCDEAQGHLFCRPVPLSVLEKQARELNGMFNVNAFDPSDEPDQLLELAAG